MPSAASARRMQRTLAVVNNHATPRASWYVMRDVVSRYRGFLGFCLFAMLVATGMLWREKPHRPTDVHNPWIFAASALALSGVFVRSWAAGILNKNQERARRGPYRFFRHPLYLGNLMTLAAFGLVIGNWLALAAYVGYLGIFACVMWQENALLASRLENERIKRAAYGFEPPGRTGSEDRGWSLATWRRNREYSFLRNVALALALLELWRVWL